MVAKRNRFVGNKLGAEFKFVWNYIQSEDKKNLTSLNYAKNSCRNIPL